MDFEEMLSRMASKCKEEDKRPLKERLADHIKRAEKNLVEAQESMDELKATIGNFKEMQADLEAGTLPGYVASVLDKAIK